MHIIPAIDIIDGKCVRLQKGDYRRRKTYHEDPLQLARDFEAIGMKKLHLVDLDAAGAKRPANFQTLKAITSQTSLAVDFGGGIKSDKDLTQAFDAGASQITGGSIAAQNRPLFLSWLHRYGTHKIILGADVLNDRIMIAGWQQHTSVHLTDYLDDYSAHGIAYVICTDISKDGMLTGPAFRTYENIIKAFPHLKLIASGGVSRYEDLVRLRDLGLYGTIVGKAIYEKRITLEQLAKF